MNPEKERPGSSETTGSCMEKRMNYASVVITQGLGDVFYGVFPLVYWLVYAHYFGGWR